MKWIDTQDIVLWSRRVDSKANLPWLVSRLIRATSPLDISITFPKGADTYTGGWDGIVEAGKKTTKVPEGISLWELSTDSNNKTKADGDYAKRLADPQVADPKNCTYIFVTANKWSQKAKWVKEKRKDDFWKDVIVYDASDLEQWLDDAPATARWFSVLINKLMPEGIQPTEEYWSEYSLGPVCTLKPKVITCDREAEVEQLKKFLSGAAAIKAVKAATKEEAIAFIIASVLQHENEEQEKFFAKSLIVDKADVFRTISNYAYPLVLITRFEDMQPLYLAASRGHHILVPLGADDSINSSDVITLPQVGHDLEDALKESGLLDEDAKKFAVESGRSITILRRLLKFNSSKINWATEEFAQSLIPALLLGRWDESRDGDKEVVSWLAGEEYQVYVDKISRWKNDQLPFIYQIGTCWRLASPFDAWSVLAPQIHLKELEKLKESLFRVLTEVKPAFDLSPDQRHMASFYGKISPYSGWLREGISQSLILLAIYGSNLQIPFAISSQEWVDEIIKSLLDSSDENLWKSLNDIMPLLAEASPESFMESVRLSIENEKRPILGMFAEDPSIITPHVYHTGLLWALEELAWFKEFLPKSTILLGKLASLDPGGSIVNRPINSLRNIFLPWLPNTLASSTERKDALLLIVKDNPDVAWHLLLMLLPEHHAVGYPTHKAKWRLFNEAAFKRGVSYPELWDMHSFVLARLIEIAGVEEDRLSKLVASIDLFGHSDQEVLLNYIATNFDSSQQNSFAIWHSLREKLHWHRSFPDSPSAYTEEGLKPYQTAYDKLKPTGIIDQNIWLFNEYPRFAETNAKLENDFRGREENVTNKRKEALQKIYNTYGIDKIIELAEEVKESFHYGQIMALFINEEGDVIKILNHKWLSVGSIAGALAGFILRSSIEYKIEWVNYYFVKLKEQSFSSIELVNFLISANLTKDLIEFIEQQEQGIQDLYWSKTSAFLYQLDLSEKEYCIRKFININRYNTALVELGHFVRELPTDFITFVLESKMNQSNADTTILRTHEIEFIFQEVYKRADYDKSRLARLEWFYLPYFGYFFGRKDNTILLQDELASNPQFFIDILKFLYKRKDGKEDNPGSEKKSNAEEDIPHKKILANNAYTLLSAWEKIPGINAEGEIDPTVLNEWVLIARSLAEKVSRLEVADVHIGKILSKYPEKKNVQWPPDEICEIIDTVNSESMKSGFKTETFNKRGSSSRGPFEGGNRERNLASYFTDLAKKIEIKWPVTSSILTNLAKGYLFDAKRIDEEAARDALEY